MAALTGKVAWVTGAGTGIGQAAAVALAKEGATVVLTGRRKEPLQETAAAIKKAGGKAEVKPGDLMKAAAVTKIAKDIEKKYGRCDILVNNDAIGIDGKFLYEITPDEWDLVFNTNLRGPYLMIRALAPLMIAARSGHIINISSLAGRNPLPKGAAYAASKWGLNGLTYSVAEELRQYNIRVSVVSPGSINTDFNDHSGRGIASGKDPKRKLQPDDIASVVATLVTQPPQCFISEVLVRPTQKP